MSDKSPVDYHASVYIGVVTVASLGGIVRRFQKILNGDIEISWKRLLSVLFMEMFVSGFCGVMAFWICEHFEVPGLIMGPIVGIVGHMGSRALFLSEKVLEKWILGNDRT